MKKIFFKIPFIFLPVVLVFAGNPNPEKIIKQKVSRFFQQKFSVKAGALQINYLRMPNLNVKNNKNMQAQIISQHRTVKPGYQTLWVELLSNGRLLKKFPVSVDVAVLRTVWIATRKIKFHRKITANMVRTEKRLISTDYDQLFNASQNITGLETKRVIACGTILTTDLLRLPLLIHSGQKVKLQIVAGNLLLSTLAVARGEGRKGDFILVRCLTTGKSVKAQIQGPGLVQVRQEFAL